ncbi:MAG: hypothetical protein CMP59_06880 [Flavobacteriales bacterium]|nr:hypothetical protein [Flavobacteriales bacterium]
MKRMLRLGILGVCILLAGVLNAQIDDYKYLRDIKGVEDQWHKLQLDSEIISKLNKEMNDLRVYGINAENDTIEAAYLLKSTVDKTEKNAVNFQMINRSSRDAKYYYSLENEGAEAINLIELDFQKDNFSYQIKLEGSNDQNEWFQIIDQQTVVSIKNELSDYKFCKLIFPNSKYQYYRIEVSSDEDPKLISARSFRKEKVEGKSVSFTPEWQSMTNERAKTTEVIIDLEYPQQIHQISLNVADTFDYYRPIEISYLVDSFETEKGWKYNYRTVYNGTLSSLEHAEFDFDKQKAQRFKVNIYDGPNPPLEIDSVLARSYTFYLLIRFTEKADYYLSYGKERAKSVRYEIAQFEDQIPNAVSQLSLGDEIEISKEEEVKKALFENEYWLWIILAAIILVLGWFSFKMISNN